MNKNFILAVVILAGMIIGAGMFSLPFVFNEVGIFKSLIYMAVFVFAYAILHMMYADLLNLHKKEHQFFFLSKNYLPLPFSIISSVVVFCELFLVLTVYLILSPTFLNIAFGATSEASFIIFWAICSIFILFRTRWIGWAELLGALCIFFIVGVVLWFGFSGGLRNFDPKPMTLATFFLPFGPLLFAMSGRPAIPAAVFEWKEASREGKPFNLKKAIFWGTAIPGIVYFLFALAVLNLSGNVTEDALSGLSFSSPFILPLLGFLGLVVLWTSYFLIGINIRDIVALDAKFPEWFGTTLALSIPLLLYYVGFQKFLPLLSFTGGVFLSLEALFIMLMWLRAFPKKKIRFVVAPLFLIFIIGFVYECFNFFF